MCEIILFIIVYINNAQQLYKLYTNYLLIIENLGILFLLHVIRFYLLLHYSRLF